MSNLTFVSFFAGIGGIDLGLERAGHRCVGQVEIGDYCNRVLEKHWPDVPRWRDIRKVDPNELPKADLWCGGFPCQDISNAGKRAGIHGERSGLFFDWMRLVRQVRPRYMLLENVSALLERGLDSVLSELSESGYDAEWDVIPAGAFGANHFRPRLFLVAYPSGDSIKNTLLQPASGMRFLGCKPGRIPVKTISWAHWSADQPRFTEMDDGIPDWPRIVSALGNAVVPQVAECIGRMLQEATP